MVSLVLLLVAVAIGSWPTAVHVPGLASRWPTDRRMPSTVTRRWFVGLVCGCGFAAAAAGGVLVGVSVGLLIATVSSLLRTELRRRRADRELAELLAATRTLAREVRSGAAPTAAILASAQSLQGTAALALRGLAARVTGDRGQPTTAADRPIATGVVPEFVERLTRAWALSARYGVPWAALIETVAVDLADRVRAGHDRSAQVSGPRVSGYVLAVMPALGVMLGAGMGADPVHVLFGTGAGHLLLVVGCALTCAGLAWTAKIVAG